VGDNSVVASKIYKSNYLFSTIAPTATGGFAVGSANGDIRLYKQMGQPAKSALPGMGEAIKAIEVSTDNQWLIATCQTYILVLPTVNAEGQSGFEKSITKSKPQAIKLSLDPRDIVKHQISRIDFTPAKFNQGDHQSDSSIVTSTGKYLVTWNFERVKKGHVKSAYKLKNLHAHAVDGQFQYNHEDKVLVTLPHEVAVENRVKAGGKGSKGK
jgi:hypothetical protein